ncbi:MAG TPA: alpha/beta hydrolase [Ideonella sp.]|uniref:alpha/beta fold hydrolase n=1 Tax=Ideonella sp. TaxID=1929293 RepID=UPI002C0AF2FE|nr:alpha/beta hydrolase [Ideonella sp.]HSI50755.1 alpha/beta hydrolase [Ideonella sp.]
MNTRLTLSSLALAAGLLGGAAPALAAELPSVVLVHGAFADGSDWAKVIPLLQARGVHVTSVQNGLESLAGDVAATQRAIALQKGKVVLVGHSWGGQVITEAGVNDKVGALVYVAAFAPGVGEAAGELGKDYPTPPGIAKLVADAQGFLSLPPQAMAEDFAQDVPAAQAAVMAVTQGAIQAKAFGDRTTVAAWQTRPSWYIVSANDRMIDPNLERAMAKKIGATVTTLPTSHVPQQSRPAEVAAVILQAVQAVAR